MVLYHAADLLWATRIKSAADAIDIAARPVRNLDMLEARLLDSPVRALIVDLDDPDTALLLIARVHSERAVPAAIKVRVLAFGPHVATDLFAAATQAGADRVMARGGFSANLADLLRTLDAPPPDA